MLHHEYNIEEIKNVCGDHLPRKVGFEGYVRPDGNVGIRNHVLVIPTVICSSHVAKEISRTVYGSTYIVHEHGCAQAGEDLKQTFRILSGFGRNPNVASVLIVTLGCETISCEKLADEISRSGKPVETLTIQEEKGLKEATEKGVNIVRKLVKESSRLKRKIADLDNLVIAVECGGSDWTSGIASNPAVGYASDLIIDNGGRIVFSETTEIIGGEHILAKRCINNKVREKLLKTISKVIERAKREGIDLIGTNPSPGNIKGGLSTIEEKSLGAILKSGTRSIVDVLEYGEEIPEGKGCYFMDTPGHDVESICGMVAGGAQLVVFTTGRGTPTGNPIAPVIKVTGNLNTFRKMPDIIDIYVGIIEKKETVKEAGRKIFETILKVASGLKTRSEINGNKEFAIFRTGYTY